MGGRQVSVCVVDTGLPHGHRLAASQFSLPSSTARPHLALLHPCSGLLGGFPACVCCHHPGPTFCPDPGSRLHNCPWLPASTTSSPPPGPAAFPHPCPYSSLSGHSLSSWRGAPGALGSAWPRSEQVWPRLRRRRLRAGMKGWFLASLQGGRDSHCPAPSLPLPAVAACLGR